MLKIPPKEHLTLTAKDGMQIACDFYPGGFQKMGEMIKQIDAFFSSKTPIARPGYPADFEGIGAYLCSDASSFHSGDTIVIDGGAVIHPAYAMAVGN